MRILLTGADGQVGREIVSHSESGIHELVALTRHELDIGFVVDVQSAVQDIQPDIVLNAAAYTDVDRAEKESDLVYAVNRSGAGNLAAACGAVSIPMVHLSTDYVFDGTKGSSYVESDPVDPLSVYANSKWEGEKLVRSMLQNHIILRTSWVFGRYRDNFVKTILRIAAERDELRVVDDQCGGPTSAGGIAEVMLHLVNKFQQKNNLAWGTYHYSGFPYVTWYEFALEIVRIGHELGKLKHYVNVVPVSTSDYPTVAIRPVNSSLSCDLIERVFGIKKEQWKESIYKVIYDIDTNG